MGEVKATWLTLIYKNEATKDGYINSRDLWKADFLGETLVSSSLEEFPHFLFTQVVYGRTLYTKINTEWFQKNQ